MPRPRLNRRVKIYPEVTYFKPAGIRLADLEETVLTVDEFEAVRLKDLQGLSQEEASKKMGVSQPTFHRTVITARKKIADAIVNGKAIRIEGGTFSLIQPAGRQGQARGAGLGGPATTCICTGCKHKMPKPRGIPCASIRCPKCNNIMIRGK